MDPDYQLGVAGMGQHISPLGALVEMSVALTEPIFKKNTKFSWTGTYLP